MRVGIITFHRALNYGALLQAFALRDSLERIGAKAQVLDYRNPVMEEMYFYPSFRQRKTIKDKIKFLIQGKAEQKRRAKFESFREKYLNLSERADASCDLARLLETYDRFITGSEQVGNYGAQRWDRNYFLHFVKDSAKKYSYAASFGVSCLPEEVREEYRNLLSGFAMCSVREMRGLEILDRLGIEKRRMDLDPTMLLTKEDWQSRFAASAAPKQKYIFAYYFELTDTFRAYVEELAAKTGCIVAFVGNPFRPPFRCKCRAMRTADPIDFVNAVANAEYVVTNSFHGTAFSIIFNKNFYVELLKTDAKVNSRIENILQTFSLENRLIGAAQAQDKVDWDRVNAKMAELRAESLNYLREIVR